MSNERERRDRAGTEGEIERNMGKTDNIGKQSIQLTMRSRDSEQERARTSESERERRAALPFPAFTLVPARARLARRSLSESKRRGEFGR